MMRRGGAHGINAGHNGTDRAIDNRIRRDVGGGVDDDTHGNPPQALARMKQKGRKRYSSGQTAKAAVRPVTKGRKIGISSAIGGYRLLCWQFTSDQV